jgi:hypothetical protein
MSVTLDNNGVEALLFAVTFVPFARLLLFVGLPNWLKVPVALLWGSGFCACAGAVLGIPYPSNANPIVNSAIALNWLLLWFNIITYMYDI